MAAGGCADQCAAARDSGSFRPAACCCSTAPRVSAGAGRIFRHCPASMPRPINVGLSCASSSNWVCWRFAWRATIHSIRNGPARSLRFPWKASPCCASGWAASGSSLPARFGARLCRPILQPLPVMVRRCRPEKLTSPARSAAEVVAAFSRIATCRGPVTLRQLSAAVFWGDSKVLDGRGNSSRRCFRTWRCWNGPLVVSVFLPESCNGRTVHREPGHLHHRRARNTRAVPGGCSRLCRGVSQCRSPGPIPQRLP